MPLLHATPACQTCPHVLVPQVSPAAWEMVLEYCSFHSVQGRSDKVCALGGGLQVAGPQGPHAPARPLPGPCRTPVEPSLRESAELHVLVPAGTPASRPIDHSLAPRRAPCPPCLQERRVFDERFVRRDSAQLCDLTSAADGLELRGLVDLGE